MRQVSIYLGNFLLRFVLLAFVCIKLPAEADNQQTDQSRSPLDFFSVKESSMDKNLLLKEATSNVPVKASLARHLPTCGSSAVRRKPLLNAKLSTSAHIIDFLYFAPTLTTKVQQLAKIDSMLVPTNSNQNVHQPALFISKMFGVSCVPTRVHFVEINGKGYLELRSGEAAWEQ